MHRVGFLSLLFAVAGCDKNETPAGGQPAGKPAAGSSLEKEKEMGEALAKETIEAFDKMVAEVAKVLEGKAPEAEVLPKLQAVYETWKPQMEALAARKAALTAAPAKGAFNGYMGEHRGKAMARKDTTLTEAFKHYRLQTNSPGVVDFLTKKPLELFNLVHN